MKKLILAWGLMLGWAWGQGWTPELEKRIDAAAQEALKDGPPGLVVGVVFRGQPVFARAYGCATLPDRDCRPEMRFAIGSVSKQFTVTALLMLQEQGKLSLQDPVAKYFPKLTRAKDITLQQLLSHTSGYSDYYPQDYLPASMLSPMTPEEIMQGWAARPLDFEPGTRWQYSNTNYVIAGAVVEKVSGMSLPQFLSKHIFQPLGMASASSAAPDASGYFRYAGGPPRAIPLEGKGWLFATGDLGMEVQDLLRWDVALMQQKLLKKPGYQQMEREVLTSDGVGSGYALGLFVSRQGDRRCLSHGGEVAGFTCENTLLPEEGCAVAVLSNQMATPVPSALANKILGLLNQVADEKVTADHKLFLENLREQRIDPAVLTENGQKFFSPEVRADYAQLLKEAGKLQSFELARRFRRGGMIGRVYRVKAANRAFAITTFSLENEKLEQFLVIP